MMMGELYGFGGVLGILVKRKVFVSYHHAGDQGYYDAFSRFFSDFFDVFYDKSLDRAYGSDNTDYVIWQIRQNDITGSSCTNRTMRSSDASAKVRRLGDQGDA